MKKVVVIGGGNGAAVSILALKRNVEDFAISAVIAMSDSGGSSGRLRQEFGTLPPGDILRGMLAMSKYDYYTLRQIFYAERFSVAGKLQNHNIGNLFVTLATKYGGSFVDTLAAFQQALACQGTVYPVTLESTDLCVEYANGQTVKGETQIDHPETKDTTITKAWLDPVPTLYKPAEKALLEADYIVFGPGSLFTSIIPNLLVGGFSEVVKQSRAKLVYVVGNGYEAKGENGPTTMAGFVRALQQYLPRSLDIIIYNTEDLGAKERRFYADKDWAVAERDVDTLDTGYQKIGYRFERDGGGLSKEKLAQVFKNTLV